MSDQLARLQAARILIVDDEKSIRLTLSAFLRSDGYTVETAENVAQAELLLSQQDFDLVVTDIVMPGSSGMALLWSIRGRDPEALVLVMTGEPTLETATEAVRAGAHDYMVKPVSKQTILHHVERAIRVRELVADKQRLEAANRAYQENLEQLVAERTRALGRSQERLTRALASAHAIAWEGDARTDELIEFGPVDEVFGLPPGTRHANGQAFYSQVHDDDIAMLRRLIQAGAVSDGTFDATFRAVTPDGSVRWIHSQGQATSDASGSPVTIRGIARDVTEYHAMQASLFQADRLSTMGMLAAGVAHEINNPLSYLLYHLESLVEELSGPPAGQAAAGQDGGRGKPDTAELAKRAKDALQGAERIRDISRALGAFSRVEQTEAVPVELHVAIEHACRMAQNEVKYRARLVMELAPGLPLVTATEGKLAQVFLNLLVNASHAMNEANAATNTIVVRTWQDGGRVCAQVRDTGSGIDPEHLARIFEPFFTTKAPGEGTGLGLSICRQILTGFGGEIGATSEVGVGTTFDLWLPVVTADGVVAEGGGAEATPAETAVAGRVLVVDDEALVREMIGAMLRPQHQVIVVGSGAEAQQCLADSQEFDAIVCDVMMPRMSGIDLHRWLREHWPDLARRVVFITGGAFTPSVSEYLEAAANPCLAKPIVTSELRAAVDHMVEDSRSLGVVH